MARPSITQRQALTAAMRPLSLTLKEQGRSQVWLARQLNISDTTIWNYIHGERRPPAGMIVRACAILGITPNEIGLNPANVEREETRQARQARQQRAATAARGSTHHGHGTNLDTNTVAQSAHSA